MNECDLLIIGGGPAGAAAAICAARAGANVVVFEKGPHGRDKVCGDGLTPRAVAALADLKIDLDGAHRIDGLRMIAGKKTRELLWPSNNRFGAHGAVLPRKRLDQQLIDAAQDAGAKVHFGTEVLPVLDDHRRVLVVVAVANPQRTRANVHDAGPLLVLTAVGMRLEVEPLLVGASQVRRARPRPLRIELCARHHPAFPQPRMRSWDCA